jgi:hypothetical protein
MFGIYAADVEFHLESEVRERALRQYALRAERLVVEPPRATRARRSPAARPAVTAWPRPIALHA